jgi:hypothetical protein
MLLYRYLHYTHAISSIYRGKLKVSTLNTVNDLHEMTPCIMGADGVPKPLSISRRVFVDSVSRKSGLISFSESSSDPVLWGHYADDHTGIVLMFDLPPDPKLVKIDYQEARLKIPEDADERTQHLYFEEVIRRKYTSWRYEQEWRYLIDLSWCVYERGKLFYQIIEPFVGVVLGCKCPIDEITMRCVLNSSGYRGVIIARAEPSNTEFEMEIKGIHV